MLYDMVAKFVNYNAISFEFFATYCTINNVVITAIFGASGIYVVFYNDLAGSMSECRNYLGIFKYLFTNGTVDTALEAHTNTSGLTLSKFLGDVLKCRDNYCFSA